MLAIDHIGIAVRDLDGAIARWCALLGAPPESAVRHGVDHARMDLAMIPVGDAFVELMSPWDETSTIAKFLDKRGDGIHHICFDTGSIAFELKRVSEEGFPVIDETPRESLGEVIAFLHPKGLNGVLVEFKEKKES